MRVPATDKLFFIMAAGSLLQAWSGWWDVFFHIVEFGKPDPLWNPAHVGLYLGTLLILLGVILNWKLKGTSRWSHLIVVGLLMQVLSGLFNGVVHRFIPLESVDFIAHTAFTLGVLIVALTLFGGLGIMVGAKVQRGYAIMASLVLAGISVSLLTAWGAMYTFGSASLLTAWGARYTFGNFPSLTITLLAFISSVVALSVIDSTSKRGYGTLVWGGFLAGVFLILVGYVRIAPFLPLGILVIAGAEVLHRYLKRKIGHIRAAASTGLFIGLLVRFVYYPLTEDYFGSLSLSVEMVTLGALGGLAGSLVAVYGRPITQRYLLPK